MPEQADKQQKPQLLPLSSNIQMGTCNRLNRLFKIKMLLPQSSILVYNNYLASKEQVMPLGVREHIGTTVRANQSELLNNQGFSNQMFSVICSGEQALELDSFS